MRANSTADAEASRQVVIEKRQGLKILAESSRAALASLPVSRLSTMIDHDISVIKKKHRWNTSEGCQNATIGESKAMCADYSKLIIEREASVKRSELITIIADSSKMLDKMPVPKSKASPVAAAMVTYLAAMDIDAKAAQVQDWIIIWLTIAIEFGAVLGPMLAGDNTPKKRKAKKSKMDIAKLTKQQRVIHFDIQMVELDGSAPTNTQLAVAAGCNAATVTRAKQSRDKIIAELAMF